MRPISDAKCYAAIAVETPLFRGISLSETEALLATRGVCQKTYRKGGLLCATNDSLHCLGFLVSGGAKVVKSDGGGKMLMSVLHPGDIFGAASMFGGGERYVANIVAMMETRAVLIPEPVWIALLQSDFRLTTNYMTYLTARIRFLSSRIDGFVKPTVEDRVLSFMESRARDGVYRPETSLRAVGEALCISRTSLYRAFDTLAASGRISKEGRNIRLHQEEER